MLCHFDLVPTVSKDRESDLPQGKKEYPTAEEVYTREVESLLKPGYKDDPKWKEMTKKVHEHNERLRKIDEQEDHLEELTNEVI